jgi:branched-chain amino acid transport system substrate-binding protein
VSGRALVRFALTLVVCVLLLAGCGGGVAQPDPPLPGMRLTIYSSLPQRGPLHGVAADVLGAERLALAQVGSHVGRYDVQLIALDASTLAAGSSDPAQISQNARRAAKNAHTVAYLGELETGSSAISVPLLNEAGILQVSPLDTAMALTTASLAVAGSPERFYPKLKVWGRTFARVVPSDRSQVDALLASMREAGVERLAILTDEDPSGRALATTLGAKAHAAGVTVVAREEIDVNELRHDDSIVRVLAAAPDGVLDATGARPGAAGLWRELSAADPQLRLFAPASLADPSFVAGLGPASAAAAHVTLPLLGAGDGSAAERRFAHAFAARYGHLPAPEARYGYEAMRSVLDAIRRAELRADGPLTRRGVVHEYFRTDLRDSVLGRYAIDASGDTSMRRWGAFGVAGGELRFERALDSASAARRSRPVGQNSASAPKE